MFKTPLELIADPMPDYWVMGSVLRWCDPVFGVLEAPKGTRTNLASIPRALQNLPFLDVDGVSRRPAAMHDYLYGSAYGRRRGKAFADDFLRAALLSEGAKPATAAAFYYAVHWFGGAAWRDYP